MRPTVRLAATRFADESERPAALERERHVVDGVHVADLAQEHARAHREILRAGCEPRAAARVMAAAPATDGTRRRARARTARVAARPCGRCRSTKRQRFEKRQPGGKSLSAGTTPSIAGSTDFGRRVGHRQRADQTARVGMARRGEQLVDRRMLRDPAGVHHEHVVAELRDDAQVVRDEQHRHAVLVLQRAQQLEDLRLHGDVERRRRLVGDQAAAGGRRSPSRS